jgi:hypothetical protein
VADTTTADIMQGTVQVVTTPSMFDGHNLFVLRERDIENRQNNQTLLITDMEGNVEYQRILTPDGLYELADLSVEIVNSTTLLVGHPRNVAFVNIYTGETRFLGVYGHHEYEYNPNNDTVFIFKYRKIEINGSDYLYDRIEEYDVNGTLVWTLDPSEFISPDMWCPYGDFFLEAPDMTHSNTLFYDADEDMIYYNPRNVNTFYKIDHKTGEVIWGLGEHGNFTMFNNSGTQVDHLFFHPHSLERVDDYTYILFDNDHHNQNSEVHRRSRMLEITINETTMEAFQSWSWAGGAEHFSFLWGDADRLPNGNRVGTFGAANRVGYNNGAHLIEVTERGDVAWRFSFQTNDLYRYGVYRMERFRYTPILESPGQVHFEPDEEVILEWQAWYNYRPKRSIPGNYTLTLNGTQIETGTFLYDRFWRPSNLTFNFGVLEEGNYEYNIEITDEAGFKSNNSIYVNVSVTPESPILLVGVSIGIVGVVVIVLIIWRKRMNLE